MKGLWSFDNAKETDVFGESFEVSPTVDTKRKYFNILVSREKARSTARHRSKDRNLPEVDTS